MVDTNIFIFKFIHQGTDIFQCLHFSKIFFQLHFWRTLSLLCSGLPAPALEGPEGLVPVPCPKVDAAANTLARKVAFPLAFSDEFLFLCNRQKCENNQAPINGVFIK